MTKNVYTALAKAQTAMEGAKKGSENPHFKSKYADLADVVAACKDALNEQGLAYFHTMNMMDGQHFMVTRLVHGESETDIACAVPLMIAPNANMQVFKSATTYAKRIGLESVTGIAPEDDDGNDASKPAPLTNAWEDAIMDVLPEDPSPETVAEAYAEQIGEEIAKYKDVKWLNNYLKKHAKHIAFIEQYAPDLHAKLKTFVGVKREEITPKVAAE